VRKYGRCPWHRLANGKSQMDVGSCYGSKHTMSGISSSSQHSLFPISIRNLYSQNNVAKLYAKHGKFQISIIRTKRTKPVSPVFGEKSGADYRKN
jgi:hypothetical protein